MMKMATRLIEIGNIDIEAIKDQYPLASVVEPYVAMKRRGNMLEGLCPFHDERSASFKIYEKDQRYHCFGCGAGGDIFDFLEAQEGLGIREAAERLTGGVFPTYGAERIEEMRAKRAAFEAQQDAKRDAAILAARERWIAADPTYTTHPYLVKKGIQPFGTRLDGDCILVPLLGADAKIQSLQSISHDGRKLFISDAPASGGFFVLGGKVAKSTGPVLLCEGFATAASLQQATGLVVVCAFNAGNLAKVCERLLLTYPDKEYIVAGDDDRGKASNVGREKAIEAAAILKCRAVFPDFADDQGTDFNDMAIASSLEAVRALVIDGELPSGEKAAPEYGDIFPLLDMDALEALPPPTYLIDELVPQHGLTVIYGDPGTKKSFIALDMALRLAFGLDWHGRKTIPVGVIYIAGEGKHGLGKRVKGWRKQHGLEGVDAPFRLLPVAVHMLDPDSVKKLLKTIDAATDMFGFSVGLTVIDTVSRAIAGHDENSQDSMSLFVDGCTEIQNHTDGAVLGVHHSGKDKERGMRGSSVLLGGVDATLRVTKSEYGDTVSIDNEKQKDEEEAGSITMGFNKIEWAAGLDKPVSTLVAIEAVAGVPEASRQLSISDVDVIFHAVEDGWKEMAPWSAAVQAKRRGRYLPDFICEKFGIKHDDALGYVMGWQSNDLLRLDLCDTRNKVSGLRVINWIQR